MYDSEYMKQAEEFKKLMATVSPEYKDLCADFASALQAKADGKPVETKCTMKNYF